MTFPFSALVGQQKMRLALLLNAIDPTIGGVLICGRRGTGKSTAVRAIANLLPPIMGVADCPYFCDPSSPRWMCSTCQERLARHELLPTEQRHVPLVTLPLNASEDRVSGSFDLAIALEMGQTHFSPGLLAQAHRGFLYVDEINLLNDAIVDLLLDAAALGVNRVEREGVSVTHPARFVLIGTMNLEEGSLRPQLLDRVGLYVDAEDIRDASIRATLVERRLSYDVNPMSFVHKWHEAEETLRERILRAQHLLPTITISSYLRQVIAVLVDQRLHAEGHRGDLVVLRTARALAAWDNRTEVQLTDIEQAVTFALPHRMRNGGSITQQIVRALEQLPGAAQESETPEEIATVDEEVEVEERTDEREGPAGLTRPMRGESDIAQVKTLVTVARDRVTRQEAGRRFVSLTSRHSGRSTRSHIAHPVTDVSFAATVRAAAPFQQARGRRQGDKLELRVDDLRQKVRERKTRSLLIFVVDGSDSVMARQLMPKTKRLLLALLQNAYEKRDRVSLLVFRFAQGRVILPPTRNFSQARRSVEELYIGGCTPLATGLLEGLRLADTERYRNTTVKPILIVLTDGVANIDLSGNMRRGTPQQDALHIAEEIAIRHIPTVLIDTNPYPTVTNDVGERVPSPCPELAEALDADYYQYSLPHHTQLLRKG